MKKESKKWILFSTLIFLSLALRVFRLNMGFWMDELITITQFVPKPWLKIITEVPYPNNHLLYTLLCKLSISLFGEKEWSARLPALILGAFTPALCYLVFRKKFSEFASFSAGLFLCFHFWAVWMSQDARGYSAFILLGFLSTYFFLDYLERGGKGLRFAYLFFTVLCGWFYLYTLFLIFGQLLWALMALSRKKTQPEKLILLFASGLLSVSLYLPSLNELYQYALSADKMAKLHPVNLIFLKELLLMLSGTKKPWFVLIFSLLALPGLWKLAKEWRGFLLSYLFSALGIVVFSALVKTFIYPRFLIFLLPLMALSLGLSLEIPTRSGKLKTKLVNLISYSLLMIMIVLLAPGLLNYYLIGKQGFKEASEYLKARQKEEELICYGIICEELGYYYREPMIKVKEQEPLTAELIKNKLIISRPLDWTRSNLERVKQFCLLEKVWRSAGYKENFLILYHCP